MKTILILLSILITTVTTATGQNSQLQKEQVQSIEKLIAAFKSGSKSKIAELVSYPLRREYPLKDVKDKNNFIQRFDDIFDNAFINRIAASKVSDWSEVGWRGITIDNGMLWIDDDGKIKAVNYQSSKEKQLLSAAIQAAKNQLPKPLQDFEKPVYVIVTKHYKIRIDEKSGGNYRYASWNIKNQKTEPDMVLENGVWEFQGSGGNHNITFKNNEYTYIVSINIIGAEETSEATLEVLEQEKTLLSEGGSINRN